MNDESVQPLAAIALRSLPGAIRRALGRLPRLRRRVARPEVPGDPGLQSRAASAVREYASDHATLFERAERLAEKAQRLEQAGTPSESARNRAERARGEVQAGLAALRESFAGGDEGRRAFDREVALRYPAFSPLGENA